MLGREFYLREDVVGIARELLGKQLYTCIDGKVTAGVITETEAYAGVKDRASHAWNGRLTERTRVMYMQGGTAYVYLCYGVHHLFNIVTNVEGTPDAILVRGVFPVLGIDTILARIKKSKAGFIEGYGPGKVSKALGIHISDTGTDLLGSRIWISDDGIKLTEDKIVTGKRIGVEYAGEDAILPYRFTISQTLFS